MSRAVGWLRSLHVGQVWLILIVMLVTGPVGFIGGWMYLHIPPVQVMDSHEEDGVASAGGELELIATKVDHVPCLTRVARWLWRYDPTDPLPEGDPRKRKEWREITRAPHSPPTLGKVSTYRLVVPLPVGIEPGDWHYLGQAIDTCANPLREGPRLSRDIPIRITAAPKGEHE